MDDPVETFEGLLDHHARLSKEGWRDNPARKEILERIARLEANQMPADFQEMYILYRRDEERGDPKLRDVRFAGYAAAFFARFCRLMEGDGG